jgi:putative hydrolase of the HAD superfamily
MVPPWAPPSWIASGSPCSASRRAKPGFGRVRVLHPDRLYPHTKSVDLRAVLFDVDFTLAKPGPDLGPEGYRRLGRRHGLELDPARYADARNDAVQTLLRHPELRHDEEMWFVFTERIIRGMGGDAPAARDLAVEMTRLWEHAGNFDLYDDVLPVLERLRRHGLKLGLVSNGGRELGDFVTHHGLEVDCAVGSRAHGWRKPHPTIFQAALELLGVEPGEAAMVGDSVEDDVEGAIALGMRGFLIDREGRYLEAPGAPQARRSTGRAAPALPATPPAYGRLPDLWGLPAALGL